MKRIILLSIFGACLNQAHAQLFSKVITGDLATRHANSRAAVFADVNNDGYEDIFITTETTNLLYLNNHDNTFTLVTGDPIVSQSGSFDGATFADCDNDGDLDGYAVTYFGQKNYFYRNNGDGSFTDESNIAMGVIPDYTETASWGDYDNDGFLDLYVSNSGGNLKNELFHNNGDGTFTRITTGVEVTDTHTSRSVNWVDYDNDGDVDLYVSNENGETDDLYQNDGAGNFTRIADAPFAISKSSSMSSCWGDIDNDGDLDLYVANSLFFAGQKNQLFINNGDGTFTQRLSGDGVDEITCNYGCSFGDYDNDGDLDLVVGSGYCTGAMVNMLFQNDGNGNFTRDTVSAKDLSTPCSYGCAFGDIDNDGFLELLIANCDNNTGINTTNFLYKNNGNGNHWIEIKLTGATCNHSAIGAKVHAKATIDGKPVWQMREVSAQSGYCGENSLIVHFGFGNTTIIDSLIIDFPGGADTVLTHVSTDQMLHVTQALSTGVSDIHKASFAVLASPNPVTDLYNLFLTSPKAGTAEIKLYNAAGNIFDNRSLFISPDTPHQLSWNINEMKLPSGLYFFRISLNGESQTQRMMVMDE